MWAHILSSSSWIAVLVMVGIVFGGLAWLVALDVHEAYRRRTSHREVDPPEYRECISCVTEGRDG